MDTCTSPYGSGMARPKMPSSFIWSMSLPGYSLACSRPRATGRTSRSTNSRTTWTMSCSSCGRVTGTPPAGESSNSTLLGLVWLAGSAVLYRHDPSGDRGGPAPAAGFRRGDARRAGAEGPAGGRRAVRARAADRRAAQVDGADGGTAGRRSSAAAAVHHVLDLGLCRGAAERGAVVRGQPAGGGAGGGRHRLPERRERVAVRGPAVLRDAGQDRELPGRGQRAPGERARLVRGGLAAVLPGKLG